MAVPATQAQLSAHRRDIQSKLEGKTYSASVEVKDPWVYYDTYVLDAAVPPTILFNNAAAKARSLSNYQYQQLPSGQAFDIYGLRCSFWAIAAISDVDQLALTTFLAKSVLQVAINNKVPQYERNLASLIGGQVHAVTAPAVTVNSKNLSVWTGDTVVRFKKKIALDQTTQWTVTILKDAANAAALTGSYLRVEMIGRLTAQL
jgi:hypothetical protein